MWVQIGSDLDGPSQTALFGNAVALSGGRSTLVVGAPQEGPNGSAHVLMRNVNDQWEQFGATLQVNPITSSDRERFGESVAVSDNGSIVAVGSGRRVVLYQFDPTSVQYVQLGEEILPTTTTTSSLLTRLGEVVDLSSDGRTLIVGEPGADEGQGRGLSYRYNTNTAVWQHLDQSVQGEMAYDNFSSAVSVSADGTIMAISALTLQEDFLRLSGFAKVFEYDETTARWSQIGQALRGDGNDDWFGASVALSSDASVLAIGASGNAFSTAGYVRAWEYNADQWIARGNAVFGKETDDWFARSIALSADGNILVTGAPENDENGLGAGQVRVFRYQLESNGSDWVQLGQDVNGEASGTPGSGD
eukprot:scaffold17996_cov194-Amphora_coffeaeformis.AAC.9